MKIIFHKFHNLLFQRILDTLRAEFFNHSTSQQHYSKNIISNYDFSGFKDLRLEVTFGGGIEIDPDRAGFGGRPVRLFNEGMVSRRVHERVRFDLQGAAGQPGPGARHVTNGLPFVLLWVIPLHGVVVLVPTLLPAHDVDLVVQHRHTRSISGKEKNGYQLVKW